MGRFARGLVVSGICFERGLDGCLHGAASVAGVEYALVVGGDGTTSYSLSVLATGQVIRADADSTCAAVVFRGVGLGPNVYTLTVAAEDSCCGSSSSQSRSSLSSLSSVSASSMSGELILTTCCPLGIPATLHVSVDGPPQSVLMTFDGVGWLSAPLISDTPAITYLLRMQCDPVLNSWRLWVNCGAGWVDFSGPVNTTLCNPLFQQFIAAPDAACSGLLVGGIVTL